MCIFVSAVLCRPKSFSFERETCPQRAFQPRRLSLSLTQH